VLRGRRGVLALRAEAQEALASAGFDADGGERLEPSDLVGRRLLEGFSGGDARFAVRRFRHGGLLRFLTGERFSDPARPFRELACSEALSEAGIPTPRVVAARARRARLYGWHLALVTRRIEGAIDLADALERLRSGGVGFSSRAALFRSIGRLVGRLHAVGFLHADLHPKNLLVDESLLAKDAPDDGAPRSWILDLDRSVFCRPLGTEERRDNLRRLYRAVQRRDARGPRFLTRGDVRRFLAAYAEGREADATPWREDWTAIQERHASRAGWHRLGWFLERLLG